VIADEGVFWIDSIEYKGELARRDADTARASGDFTERVRELVSLLAPDSVALKRVENLLTSDDLEIELPRELVLLGPLFRLDVGGERFDEATGKGARSRLEGGKLRLRFDSVGKALDGAPQELRVVAESALGDFALVLERTESGNYAFARVERP
jgi:hypothetical protein